MAGYRVLIGRSAADELEKLPKRDRIRVIDRVAALAEVPRPRGCERLSGDEKYRVRQGRIRILFEVNDAASTVTVVKIGLRRDAYR